MSETSPDSWRPVESDPASVAAAWPDPLMALAAGRVPAFVWRGAHAPDQCEALMQRFAERGYFDRATVERESQLSGGPYLDLGTSLGRVGAEREAFFAHAARTHDLFAHLFDGLADPVATIYGALSAMAGGRRVHTAHDEDGRRYGPAIFRIYQAEEGHKPHFDSVRLRARTDYEVARHRHQFAVVLCMQKGDAGGDSILYRARAEGEVIEAVEQKSFHDYAAEHDLARVRVELNAGDLYLFSTETIHEVPLTVRRDTRVVLAVFAATSPEADEVVVWS